MIIATERGKSGATPKSVQLLRVFVAPPRRELPQKCPNLQNGLVIGPVIPTRKPTLLGSPNQAQAEKNRELLIFFLTAMSHSFDSN